MINGEKHVKKSWLLKNDIYGRGRSNKLRGITELLSKEKIVAQKRETKRETRKNKCNFRHLKGKKSVGRHKAKESKGRNTKRKNSCAKLKISSFSLEHSHCLCEFAAPLLENSKLFQLFESSERSGGCEVPEVSIFHISRLFPISISTFGGLRPHAYAFL